MEEKRVIMPGDEEAGGEEETTEMTVEQKIDEVFVKLESEEIVMEQAIDMVVEIDSQMKMINPIEVIKDLVNFQRKREDSIRRKEKQREIEEGREKWVQGLEKIRHLAVANRRYSDVSKRWFVGKTERQEAEAWMEDEKAEVDKLIEELTERIQSQYGLDPNEVKDTVIAAIAGIMFRMAEIAAEGGEQ